MLYSQEVESGTFLQYSFINLEWFDELTKHQLRLKAHQGAEGDAYLVHYGKVELKVTKRLKGSDNTRSPIPQDQSSQAGHSLGITRQVMRQGQDQAKKAARSSCLFAGHELKHSSPSRYWTMLKNTLVHTNHGLHTEHHAFPVSAWNRKDMKVPYLFKILKGLKKSFCH